MTALERRHGGAVRDRLDRFLAERGLEAVWFARSDSFAWLTGGDNAVDRAAEPGCAAVGYDGDGLRVVTDSIERDRLAAEELPDGVPVASYPWHEGSLAAAVAERSARPAAADFAVPGVETVDAGPLRRRLTDAAVERYREVGRDVARAVEATGREVEPSTTERQAAAAIRRRLADAGVDAPVVLVGGARRAGQYRHYTPTDEPLGEYALLSVTGRRGGLYASCTRTVAFDPSAWLRDRHAAAARVETAALAATRRVAADGGTAGDVFDAVRAAYAAVGHEGEWREHHQGGATGYAGREWIATPDHGAPVTRPTAYAWNPTVAGAKSEDTALVTGDGIEVLTATGDWPTLDATAPDADLTLARPAVLVR